MSMLGFMLGKMFERDRDQSRGGGGGGGRARIRFGRTGPRGRMYSTQGAARIRSSIVKASFVRKSGDTSRHITAHLKYIQDREKGELEKDKDRDFFNRDKGDIERNDVEKAMKENQGDRASMYKLILSPGDNNVDLRDYTRESMEALENRLGHKLDWYGVEHLNTDNHHVHVVIAGKVKEKEYDREKVQEREEETERRWSLNREQDSDRTKDEAKLEKLLDRVDRDRDLKETAAERGDVYLDRNDLAELKAAGNEYRLRERSFDKALEKAWEKEFGREPEKDREKEREHPHYREPAYTREKADEMIDNLLEKTTDRLDEDRLIESTDGYSSFLDKILEQDREHAENFFKDDQEKDLPPARNEEVDKLLELQRPFIEQEREPEKEVKEPELEEIFESDKQKEKEEYQQRTGFADAAEPEKTADDSWKTFEADRQVSEQQQSQEPEKDKDIDRFDDFGR